VFFASASGLEWVEDRGGSGGPRGILVPANGRQVLDVLIAPSSLDGSSSSNTLYFTIFGPRSAGGGVYRVAFPKECSVGGSSGGDGGTSTMDGGVGFDAGPGDCSPASCPSGCCKMNVCQPGDLDNACGKMGQQCVTCAPVDFCDPGTRVCTAG
jgi:hypothetical protein